MPDLKRGIDHLVLCSRDLAAARDLYRRLGFTTTPPAEHPFGTGNSLVQLQGNFLELITVVAPQNVAPPSQTEFSFGDTVQRFLAKREGMAMLVFESQDAVADQAEFAGKGIDTFDPLHFQRQAKLPDGSSVTVAFSLAFATAPELPEAVFFTCQQHAPEYFWKPEYQVHENTAQAVDEVVMVADQPAAAVQLLGRLQGQAAVERETGAVQVLTARGYVTVLPPDAFQARFGARPPAAGAAHFAAYRIIADDLAKTAAVLDANEIAYRRSETSLIVDAAAAQGIVLEFSEE